MRKRALLMCFILVSSVMLTTAAVTAKKPPKPPDGGGDDPTGTIYFSMADDNGDACVWTMNADGSSKTNQALMVDYNQDLSWEKHNGKYWYVHLVAIDGETYPDGMDRYKICAFKDDNTGTVTLMNDDSMAFQRLNWCGSPIWVPGDDYISWAGKEWTDNGDGTYTEDNFGIYRAAVQYAANGDVSGLGTPSFVYETDVYYDTYDGINYPDLQMYDWNPDGSKITYNTWTGSYIYIDSISNGGSPTQLVEGGWPTWSPDGSMIMFGRVKEVLVINVDGTGLTSIVKVKTTKGSFHDIMHYGWSPDGKFIQFSLHERNRHTWAQKTSMYTIGADGSGGSQISGFDSTIWKVGRDWR